MKIVGYLRPSTADQLDALAARLERPKSWCVSQAIERWLRSAAAQIPDTAP